MTNIKNLFYADYWQVQEVPATRDRLMSVTPVFHTTRRAALIAVKEHLRAEVQKRVERMVEIEREIAGMNE